MAEQPVQARQDEAAPVRQPVESGPPLVAAPYWHAPRPRVVVKADLIPAISVLSTVGLLGMLVGFAWSRLAPTQHKLVYADQLVPLTDESYHRFDALAVFAVLCLAAGVVTGAIVWLLRERRGPVVMIAAVLGGGLAAWLAQTVGTSWAASRYAVTGAPKVGDVIAQAPELETAWGLLAWPLATALVYGVLAAWNGMPDLGRRLG